MHAKINEIPQQIKIFNVVYFHCQVNDPSLNINHHHHHHHCFFLVVLDVHQNQDHVEHGINEDFDYAKINIHSSKQFSY